MEGYRINAVDVRSYTREGVAELQHRGIKNFPALIYLTGGGSSKQIIHHGWKSKAEMRKMFEHVAVTELEANME